MEEGENMQINSFMCGRILENIAAHKFMHLDEINPRACVRALYQSEIAYENDRQGRTKLEIYSSNQNSHL